MHYSVINEQFKIMNSMQIIHVQCTAMYSHVNLLVTEYINLSVSESMSGFHGQGYSWEI